jgi:hypothetical protein
MLPHHMGGSVRAGGAATAETEALARLSLALGRRGPNALKVPAGALPPLALQCEESLPFFPHAF